MDHCGVDGTVACSKPKTIEIEYHPVAKISTSSAVVDVQQLVFTHLSAD